MKTRRIAALLAAGALLLTFASTAFATAESKFDWQGNGYPNETCTASSASMLWVWTGDSPTSLTINGNLQAGSWVQEGGGAWHFATAIDANNYPPTSASVMYTGTAGVLTLSHCDGTQATPTPTLPVQSESIPPTSSPTPSDSPTPSISDSPSPSISDSPTPSISDSPSPSASESIPVQSESLSPTPTVSPKATPSGSVLAETGTPQITPPSTDTLGTPASSGGNGLPMVLAAVSALLLAVLVATPARKRSRR